MASKYMEIRTKRHKRGAVPRGGGFRAKGSFDSLDRYRQHCTPKRYNPTLELFIHNTEVRWRHYHGCTNVRWTMRGRDNTTSLSKVIFDLILKKSKEFENHHMMIKFCKSTYSTNYCLYIFAVCIFENPRLNIFLRFNIEYYLIMKYAWDETALDETC